MEPCKENNPTVQPGTLLVHFAITGPLACLSHQETLTFWQRFLVRCGLPLAYRGGFNPRPRLSLPLPRTVGLQADDDLLTAEVEMRGEPWDGASLAARMNTLLPEGLRVTSVTPVEGRVHARPVEAVYRWSRGDKPAEAWRRACRQGRAQLESGEPILMRRTGPKDPDKTIDLRSWVLSLECSEETLEVRCAITPEGTARIDEMMNWLGLRSNDLAEPVRRISVVWKMN